MEFKGYLRNDGTVTQAGPPSDVLGVIFYKETRYNLVRVLVTRDWLVYEPDAEGRRMQHGPRCLGNGDTRREAIARAQATVRP